MGAHPRSVVFSGRFGFNYHIRQQNTPVFENTFINSLALSVQTKKNKWFKETN